MRTSAILSLATFGAVVNGHGIFQKLRINGAEQPSLYGIRAPAVNNPVTVVSGASIICNTGLKQPVSKDVVTIPAGAKVGAWFQHIIGGAQGANDPDNPIAASHKGPIMVYLAKVDSAGIASEVGLNWFKIAQEGLDNSQGKWGVDTMIANKGWWDFTMPSCLAPGDYLMRIELLALHSAYSTNGAQFYMSCANIKVTGSGAKTGSSTVKFPGAYNSEDPGIKISIYSGTIPNNAGKPYTPPGGPVALAC
ncbi:lytic polysaccharide monooxygenase [Cadophora sp. DSE1049]|nr:lytic polysaccharide monooxygenase [Cadophora sp. DSE1049]